LLNAALAGGQWWLAMVIVLGGLLAAAYVFRFFSRAFRYVEEVPAYRRVPRSMEFAALGLGLVALLLGVTGNLPFEILRIGSPLTGPVLTGGSP
jgi:formate hydrogenlyase subunit 3/multisubunit Na+/H+ antiporter MnhD subunit